MGSTSRRVDLLYAVLVTLVAGCGTVEETSDANTTPDVFSVSVSAAGAGGGTITSSPAGIDCGATCTSTFEEGSTLTLTATADPGSEFTGWMGGGCTGIAPCSITVTADVAVTARFAEKKLLTVTKAGSGTGTVTSSPAGIDCGADCTESLDAGTSVTLSATETGGSTFLGWSGGCTGTGSCVVTVTADTTVTATFALNNSVDVVLAGNGSGRVRSNPGGIDCGTDCSEQYAPGTTVTLTAEILDDSTLSWSGACAGSDLTCSVLVDQARMVTATFTKKKYSLTIIPTGGNGSGTVTSTNPTGIVCPTTCTAMFDSGTVVMLSAMEATGSTFSSWSGGGCPANGPCNVTLVADTTVTAAFTLTKHTLMITKSGNASAANSNVRSSVPTSTGIDCGVDCMELYDYGTSVTLNATVAPNTGTVFMGWSGGGCSGMGPCTTTITQATTVDAKFDLTTHLLMVEKVGSGSGTVTATGINCGLDCMEMYNFGTNVTLTAAPTLPNSAFMGWTGGGCGNVNPCTVPITAATTVQARFESVIRATWDPAFSVPGITYSNGNLSISGNSVNTKNARTTIGKSSGKWYWEVTATGGTANVNHGGIGIVEAAMPNNVLFIGSTLNPGSGMSFGYGDANNQYYTNWTGTTVNGAPPVGSDIATGRVFMFALDMSTGRLWTGTNGVWHNGGDPATNTNPVISGLSGTVFPGATFYANSTNALTANFGGTAFVHGVPAGFQPGLFSLPTTWDPAWSPPGQIAFTNSNLSMTSLAGVVKNARASLGKTSGKWYWEIAVTNGVATTNDGGVGILDPNHTNNAYLGFANRGMSFGYGTDNTEWWMTWPGATRNGVPPAGSAIATGTIYMFALDLSTGRLWTGHNGTWHNSGNPAAGTNPVLTGLTGTVFPGATLYDLSVNAYTANFGATAFAHARPAGFAPFL